MSRFVTALLLGLVIGFVPVAVASDDFSAIPPEDLAMKQYAGSPGAAAIILERELLTNAAESTESHHARIKILTDEGKKYADVEIPYAKDWSSVEDIRARTVHPDGTVVPFTGKPFEKMVVRYRGFKVLAKTFSLPDVEVGSVIEYRYTLHHYFSGHWAVQEDLFTRHAYFKLKPSSYGKLAVTTARLPAGKQPEKQSDGTVVLDLTDIPAFQAEDFTFPADELKMRVDFFYVNGSFKTTDEFWKDRQQAWLEADERYLGKLGNLQRTVNEVAPATDPLPVRLQKLYARVQQLRNLSFEVAKSEKETAKENLKESNNVEDVLKHGYGNHAELNLLFLALARAAGAHASMVRVSERDDHLFHPSTLDDRQFDGTAVLIQEGSPQVFLDPGTYHCPYGLLPWEKTETAGMLLSKDAHGFISTAVPKSTDSLTERKADLDLAQNGTLKGTVQIVFHGQEALIRRVHAHNQDAVARSKDLEEEIKGWVPSGGTVKLVKVTGWDSTDDPLQADFEIELPGFASRAGHRLIVPLGLFKTSGTKFEHATRMHPIYFEYPYQDVDDISIHLPPDLQIESLPKSEKIAPGDFFSYEAEREQKENTLFLHRRLQVNGFYLQADKYPAVKEFFRRVMADDDAQALLRPAEAHADK